MLRVLKPSIPSEARQLEVLMNQRQASNATTDVSHIIAAVRDSGDQAIQAFTAKYDQCSLEPSEFRVDPDDIAEASIKPEAMNAMRRSIERIKSFHSHEQQSDWWITSADGAMLGQLMIAMNSVGIYVPGGAAAYASSLLMSAIPARIAGVQRIVVVTPPDPEGVIDPSILVAARLCEIDEIYRVGGAQAIAALAYGTAVIPRVAKIVGPGNAYVAAAKRQVYGTVGIDTIAGPSEIVILADESANPRYLAADLLAQAEHDDDAFVLLITTSQDLVSATNREIESQLADLDRASTIRTALATSIAVVVADLETAIEQVNAIAPEHLELFVTDPLSLVSEIETAGVILCGPYSPAALCDYGIGPNHILPTGGAGRFSSALGVNDFTRRVSVVNPSKEAFCVVAPDGIALANIEGLTAHAAAMQIRLKESR